MEGFREFYAWTDYGEPIWIRNVWTEEEMWENWYARIGAARVAHKVSGNGI